MKVVIAPDKFKDCLPAPEVAKAIAAGITGVDAKIEIDLCPMADGGEGTVAALVAATGGKLVMARVTGPLPEMKVNATYGFLGGGETAVIEMAAASGVALLNPEDRNPLNTTTFGTGELIVHAIANGAKKIILGIGGSATIDAGIGCAQACGFTVLMNDGQLLSPTEPLCGRDLDQVLTIKHARGEVTNGIPIAVACDVINPLTGPTGAARVFGPQKGATPAIVEQLEKALNDFAMRTGKTAEAQMPGCGAAGGLGFGLLAFFSATLQSGAALVAETVKLRDRLANGDLCITGEGRLDAQTAHGKAVAGVAQLCAELKIPCIALAGQISPEIHQTLLPGLTACFSILDQPMPLEAAHQNTPRLLRQTTANIMRLFQLGVER